MRKLSLLLVAFCTGLAPVVSEAGPPPNAPANGQGKGKGKDVRPDPPGKGNKPTPPPKGKPGQPPGKSDPGKDPGKGGSGGNAVVATLSGGGQRLHFSFGGEVTLRQNDRITGEFIIVGAPQAPAGSLLTVSCRYRQFSDPVLSGIQLSFVGRGVCTRLSTTGEITEFRATNRFRVVDNGQNDVIDIQMVGSTGISVPVGTLSFGNFTLDTSNLPT